jgi:nitroreductase
MKSPLETAASPSVSHAIETRRSVRAFTHEPVDEGCVRRIIEKATRAASGGNVQPWHLYVLAGAARDALVDRVAEKSKTTPFGDGPAYEIYPRDLKEPHKTWRGEVAREMYELVGLTRDDKAGRAAQMAKNFEFFGAPVGMILTLDRQMGPPQYCDLGLFLSNIMLLAREEGLHTCPQEAWSLWHATIRQVVGIPEEEMVFCGLALGRADPEAAINRLHTDRAPVEQFARFDGF